MIVRAPDRRIQLLRPAEELPFSLHNALAAGAPRWGHGHHALPLHARTGDLAEETAPLVASPSPDGEKMTAWRTAQWVALFSFVAFILVVVVLAGVMTSRVADMVENLDSTMLSERMQGVIFSAQAAADNTEQATQNVLSMTELAKNGMLYAAPKIDAALNESAGAVHSVVQLASHPTLTLTAG